MRRSASIVPGLVNAVIKGLTDHVTADIEQEFPQASEFTGLISRTLIGHTTTMNSKCGTVILHSNNSCESGILLTNFEATAEITTLRLPFTGTSTQDSLMELAFQSEYTHDLAKKNLPKREPWGRRRRSRRSRRSRSRRMRPRGRRMRRARDTWRPISPPGCINGL